MRDACLCACLFVWLQQLLPRFFVTFLITAGRPPARAVPLWFAPAPARRSFRLLGPFHHRVLRGGRRPGSQSAEEKQKVPGNKDFLRGWGLSFLCLS